MNRESMKDFRIMVYRKYDRIGDFCNDIGVSRQYLNRVMHSGNIRLALASKIADKLGVGVNDVASLFLRS